MLALRLTSAVTDQRDRDGERKGLALSSGPPRSCDRIDVVLNAFRTSTGGAAWALETQAVRPGIGAGSVLAPGAADRSPSAPRMGSYAV